MDLRDVTIAAITFKRPRSLSNLLASARARYPEIQILVADDSGDVDGNRRICDDHGAAHLPVSFDAGIPVKRNVLIDCVGTPLTLICDDDHEFGPRTSIEEMIAALTRANVDMLAATVVNEPGGKTTWGRGVLFRWRGILYCTPPHLRIKQPHAGVEYADFVENFFLARTEEVRRLRWNERLKLYDHVEFFWRAKIAGLRVGMSTRVIAIHRPERPEEYAKFISRNREWRPRMLDEIGVREFRRLKTGREFDGERPPGVSWREWVRGDALDAGTKP